MKSKKIIFAIITLLWVAVIFSFSLQPGDVSGDLSGSLIRKILAFFVPGFLDNPEQLEMLHFIFRKCAHFTEFMILGVLSRITLQYMNLRYKGVFGLGFCVAVAALDETIQLFVSGRAGRVQDVLIDSAGAVVGIFVVVIMFEIEREKVR